MLYASLSAEELVRLCAEKGNDEAWEEFVRRFHSVIGSTVTRVARRCGETSESVIDDLIQETYLKVCADQKRLLRDFQPQHPESFQNLLRVTAANAARDYYRALRSSKRGSGHRQEDVAEVENFVCDSHATGSKQIETEILIRQIDEWLAASSSPTADRDRRIFWLYYQRGLTAEAIAAISIFGLTVKGVESILHRLKKAVRLALVNGHGGTPTEGYPEKLNIKRPSEGIKRSAAFLEGEGQS